VENTEFILADKGTHVLLTVQDRAYVFLRSQGYSSLLIHCTWTNGESAVLFGSANKVMVICLEEETQIWPDKWILHHDSVPVHDALRVREFLAKKSIAEMDHSPYSPHVGSCDF
jgi:hypothetical protein